MTNEPETPQPDDDPFTWFPPGTKKLLTITLVAGLVTLAVQLFPFNFQGETDDSLLAIEKTGALIVLFNMALFLPVGFLEGWIAHNIFGCHAWVIFLVVLDLVLLAFIGETGQLWLPDRYSSLIDLIANTIGGTAAAIVADYCAPALNARFISDKDVDD